MNSKYFLPVAAVFLAACSDVTAPSNLDLSYGKSAPPPPPPPASVETFESGIASLGAWNMTTLAVSPGSSSKASTTFLGQLSNELVTLSVPAGKSSVTISFDLYIIGTWDGVGQQGFGSDQWQIEVSSNGGARQNVFLTTFSNQATKNQNFPRDITGGSSPAGRGAAAVNALGYPRAMNKNDLGDAIYHLTYTVSNPGAGPLVFYFHSATPLQGGGDETWGLDNVSVSGS